METMESEGFRGMSCDMILVEDGPVEGSLGLGLARWWPRRRFLGIDLDVSVTAKSVHVHVLVL